jgi:multicomponent Na+:H+ antiporter subunit A
MILLLALHAVLGLGVIAGGERLQRRALLVAGLAPLAALVWLVAHAAGVIEGTPVTESFTWVPELGLDVDLRLDGFALLLAVLVSGIGVLVFWYSHWYFPATQEGLGRLVGLLTLFSGSMFGLVVADNLLVLYGCWELTSITSYLLIGNKYADGRARAAALQALLITGAGGLAMLGGFVVIGQQAGTYQLSAILADPPSGTAVTAALVLVLLGAATKSAQYPFHSWLPGAMVAPTPISAYLHSATMVKAGVYLVARFTPAFADVPFWRPAVVTVGLVTMVCGGLRALRQSDLKLLLAFGTVSQLGFLFVLFGMGTEETVIAGCTMLLAHALFKAGLFMGVGVIDHQVGTREVARLPVLDRGWRAFTWLMVFIAAAMAGLPLTFGFVAKEEAYQSLLDEAPFGEVTVIAVVVFASMLTFAYSARFLWGAFWYPRSRGAPTAASDDAPSAGFLAAPAVIGAVLLVLDVLPGLADSLLTAASQALDASAAAVHLAMWHGFNLALLLSAVTVAGGLVLFVGRRSVARVLVLGAALPTGGDAYRASLRGLNRVADRVTGVVQNGSLPVYAGVILLTAAALPGIALAADWPDVDAPPLVDQPGEVLIAALILGSALGAAVIRRRFAAALLLGMAGYGMAGLFVVMGAPDLALTQTAIETLTTVLFVLVLRRLPDRFERRAGGPVRVLRVAVAATVGLVVFAFALAASGERIGPPVSDEMTDLAYPEGHGRNVVNVILVDFRGFDTMGEITVLAAAAIGAVALARAGRRPGAPANPAPADAGDAEPARPAEVEA